MELDNYFVETAFDEMYEFEHKEDWSKVDLVRMLRNAYMALKIYQREFREIKEQNVTHMKCRECSDLYKGYWDSSPEAYVCVNGEEPFEILDINAECVCETAIGGDKDA